MVITEWDAQDRPREKMMANGAASLTDAELLAILLVTGKKGKTAVDVARELLNLCDNSLITLGHTLLRGTDDEKKDVLFGIGPAKVCQIQAALELGLRHQNELQKQQEKNCIIDSSVKLFNLFNQQMSQLSHEELWAVYCSNNGKLVFKKRISEGGITFSGCDLKKVCRPAIEYMASAVALCHNHPQSGLNPSRQDIEITEKVKDALNTIDVRLLDHIIIADGRYYSLQDNGYL